MRIRWTALLVVLGLHACWCQDLQADLFMSSPDTKSIKRYTNSGKFLEDFVGPGAGGLQSPGGLAFGPDGLLYVSDNEANRILRYNGTTGGFIDIFAEDPMLNGPTDLKFHEEDLFVALWKNGPPTGGVARLDAKTGELETTIGTGFRQRTHSIVFGRDGLLYASHFDLSKIRVFNPDTGAEIRSIGTLADVGRPMGITFNDDGNLMVSDWNGTVRIVNPDTGALISTLINGLNNTQWHAIAPDGSLLVDDWGDKTIGRYNLGSGASQGQFANVGVMTEKFVFHNIPEPSCSLLTGLACLLAMTPNVVR